MTKNELILKLQELPDDIEIRIVDYKLNVAVAEEGGEEAGIYDEFDVVMFAGTDEYPLDEEERFAAIVFHNPDIILDDEYEVHLN